MALPRKHSRVIVVDGLRYRWLLPRARRIYTDRMGGTDFTVQLLDRPGSMLRVNLGSLLRLISYGSGGEIWPSVVAHCIRVAIKSGWRPTESAPFEFSPTQPEEIYPEYFLRWSYPADFKRLITIIQNNFKTNVDSSRIIAPETKELLKQAFDAIEAAQIREDDRDVARFFLHNLLSRLVVNRFPDRISDNLIGLGRIVPAATLILTGGREIVEVASQLSICPDKI